MKRVTKQNVKTLSDKDLKSLYLEKGREKQYLRSIDKENRFSGKINTIENHIAILKDEIILRGLAK